MRKSLNHYWYWIKRNIVRRVLYFDCIRYWLARRHLRLLLKMLYFNWKGIWPNLNAPTDLNEALMKMSVKHQKDPISRNFIVKCADKYAVRKYVEEMGYGNTLNELIGVYDRVEEINLDILPDKFVMKMNNASGRNFICLDKSNVDWSMIKKQFSEWLKDNKFGLSSGEWHYSLIKPKIVIEKYLSNFENEMLIDYKFNVIGGKAYSCFVAYNRNPNNPHGDVCFDDYDMNWNLTENIIPQWHKNRRVISKPLCFDKMVKMAEDLCKGFEYVRFDVYEINGNLMFGEMTFTPQGCVLEFYSDDFLKKSYMDNLEVFA